MIDPDLSPPHTRYYDGPTYFAIADHKYPDYTTPVCWTVYEVPLGVYGISRCIVIWEFPNEHDARICAEELNALDNQPDDEYNENEGDNNNE